MKLPKTYEPGKYEADIYDLWEKSEAFKPLHRGSDETYSIVIPPPNANGDLHLGHGLTLGIEDIAIRYNRMLGKKTLFLPGADHAGFETQSVYEKRLAKEGKSRFDFSREELYSQIYEFVAQNKTNYESQFRKIGASLDWDHFTYTLDQKIIDRAYATFKQMWEDKLVYRGERLVNYCTFHGTGFADIEVEHREVQGHIWTLKYPLTDGSGEVMVATTRPETMLGDVAVAVHPEDDRYKHLLGKTVKLPLTNREVPVLADDFVEQEFGTGAVKITPAHDPNDYAMAERHNLPMITVINYNGTINHSAPEAYRGLSVKEAREKVVADLKAHDSLARVEEHTNNIGHCYKCGTVIEPLLKEQWFVDMKPLARRAIEALQAGKITFYPDSKREQLIHYLENLRDWNISRQIAWGIPIPAFQNVDNPEDWIFDTEIQQEIIERDGKTYRRDPDVFDTWFSSSSWPYATLDYPDSQDFKDFYPLSVMETGADILYPWVSRMLMFGLYVTDDIPFENVYLHGLILDSQGVKMSKSKDNMINPMEKIDLYGSDAFRMGIITGQSAGNNQSFDETRIVAARNFCNKLWNIARYIEDTLGEELIAGNKPDPKTTADHWVIHQLNEGGELIGKHLATYRFSEAYETLYHLIWDDVADWYIEASKSARNTPTMSYVMETILKLAHPFAPFVTETIWQTLHPTENTLLVTSAWPPPVDTDQTLSKDFDTIKSIVTEARQIKTLLSLKNGTLMVGDEQFVTNYGTILAKLARLEHVIAGKSAEGLQLIGTKLPSTLLIDTKTAQEFTVSLLEKEIAQVQQIKLLKDRLNNESYIQKAPEKLVNESRERLGQLQTELATTKQQIERFKA